MITLETIHEHAKNIVAERLWRIDTGKDYIARVVAYKFPEAPKPVQPVVTEAAVPAVVEPPVEIQGGATVLKLTDQDDRTAAARAELDAILANSGADHENPYGNLTGVPDDQKVTQ